MSLKTYRELKVWQRSMELAKEIYSVSGSFPKDELFGITSQMQRAVVSIPSNIAEGYLRQHNKEYIQFLYIALGSAAELETQILLSKELEKFKRIDFTSAELLLTEVMKMLYVLIERIKKT